MKKTKLKERIKKAAEAFWSEEENTAGEIEITHGGESFLLQEESASDLNFRKIFSFLKQALLFLPGTFFTFYLWMGIALFGFPRSGKGSMFLLLILLFSSLSMVLGLGNIKNLRHWVIPFSVIVLGFLIGLIATSLGLSGFLRNFENAILFFPLALITAVLSKNLVDSLSQEKTN